MPCEFMATSIVAPASPKQKSAAAIHEAVGVSTVASRAKGNRQPAITVTLRLPTLEVSEPASGMATIAPSPLSSSTAPSCAVLR